MKRKRNLLVVLLLVCTLAIGVGYAAFTQEMVFDGTLGVTEKENLVVFKTAVEGEGKVGAPTLGAVSGQDSNHMTMSASGFKNVGDKLVVKVTVHNPHDFKVKINEFTITQPDVKNNNEKLLLQVAGAIPADQEIAAEGDYTFEVTFTCLATTPVTVTDNFTITFEVDGEVGSGHVTP